MKNKFLKSLKIILDNKQFIEGVESLSSQILKRNEGKDFAIIGIQQGGVVLSDEIFALLSLKLPNEKIKYGQLDITFYRDDLRKNILSPDKMNIPFAIENMNIILIDDVLFTGRTIKAALDVLLDYGRPAKVELCVLADRKEHRQFPIQADYCFISPQTKTGEKIKLLKDKNGNKELVLIGEEK